MAGTNQITKNIGNSSRNAYPARATPKYILIAATKNHPPTNAIVAVPIAFAGFGAAFAAAANTPQATTPPRMINAVRIFAPFWALCSITFVIDRRAYHTASLCLRPQKLAGS